VLSNAEAHIARRSTGPVPPSICRPAIADLRKAMFGAPDWRRLPTFLHNAFAPKPRNSGSPKIAYGRAGHERFTRVGVDRPLHEASSGFVSMSRIVLSVPYRSDCIVSRAMSTTVRSENAVSNSACEYLRPYSTTRTEFDDTS
jgi:hypothetical protein